MKITALLKLLSPCALLICWSAISQSGKEEYTFVNIEQGITQRAVSTITQDHLGLIWMGTNGVGLNKYNGVDFISYKLDYNNPNSLNSPLIYITYLDTSNRLWVGTEAGLNLYNRDFDSFERVSFYKDKSLNQNIPVRAITEDINGELIIGTHFNGLFKVNPETFESQSIPINTTVELSNLQINSLVKNKNGKVFVGSNIGLFEYENFKVSPVLTSYDAVEDSSNITYNIESMLLDDDGSLWLGTFSNGLIKIGLTPLDSYVVHNYKISDKRILALTQAPDGRVLCGTENDGLFVVDKNGVIVKNYIYNKLDNNGIKSNSIWSLFVDDQDRIWIGYYNRGVGKYDWFYDKFKDIESFPNINNSLQSSSVTGIVEDKKGRLWIGMDGGGVDVYNPITQQITHLSKTDNPIATGMKSMDVQTLFMDSKDNLWIGTWNAGIFYLPKNGTSFINYNTTNTDEGLKSNRIMSFSEDSNGIIWIGSFLKGLHSYNPKMRKFTFQNDKIFRKLKIGQGDIRKVLVDHNDIIWIATTNGLYQVFHTSDDDFKVVSLTSKMYQDYGGTTIVNVIVSLFEDKTGKIWIGTDGAGLCEFDPSLNTFVWYNSSNGLLQETIATIIEADNGDIWMGGNKGLSQLNTKTDTFKNYDIYDGLLANDFNFNGAFKDQNGTLYFGNYGGLNYFDPNNIPINNNIPRLYFTDFKLFNKSVMPNAKDSPLTKNISQTTNLSLNHKQSVFTIEYTGINYTRPEKNQYAYYLDGFEDTWNYVDNSRSATYTNLSPGEYTFKVKAANNDGVWNEMPIKLSLTVLPAWWATKFALLSYALLIILITYFIVKYLNERLEEKRLIKFERDKMEQGEELNNRKLQFFTNISHEFRTPLTLILNPLEDIIQNTKLNLPKRIKEKHAIIHKNTIRLKRLLDELMDFRKLQMNKLSVKICQIEAVSFVKEVTTHFEEEASLKNIMFSIESDEIPIDLWTDPGMLEKIIFNILSNAFKITLENGVVSVGIFRCNNKVIFPLINKECARSAVEIAIEDTGSGINMEELKKIFERFYQVKKMNSQYYGGTGIGLEVVKSFVDLLKGKIVVESEEAVGTKFRIFLPLGNSHFEPNELLVAQNEKSLTTDNPILEQKKSTADNGVLATNSIKKTLLIVEDNTELRTYLKNELENEYTIIEAANGSEGLLAATQRNPDLIITDVVMPEMDGFEFCTRIKQDLKTSHLPVLMLTAKAMSDDWVKGIDSGADVYLSKPFEMKVLRAQLKQIIVSRQILFNKYLKDTNNIKVPENTSPLDKKFIAKVLDYINDNIADENLNVEQLAEELHLSRSQLYRKIKALTGQTANEFLRKIRLEKAKQMIGNGNESISEICFKVGFSSPSYFTKCFKSHFGVLPTELKQE